MSIIHVPQGHALRATTEAFIAKTYADHYGASSILLPPRLHAIVDSSGAPVCACGVRFAEDGFLSESYLDRSAETTLSERCGSRIERSSIFEVASLASRSPRASFSLLLQIIAYGEHAGFEWALFTATQRLRSLLSCLGLELETLSEARPERLRLQAHWGSYYEHAPQVCAVSRTAAAQFFKHRKRSVQHA